MKQIFDSLKKQSPSRIIALGFSAVILVGAVLLMMPFSLKKGVHLSFLNALFTSTSAVCVTGLVVVDTADSFTAIGNRRGTHTNWRSGNRFCWCRTYHCSR